MTQAAPVLSTRNLVKKFGGVVACDGVNFDLLPGELHAVIGPNGAGKTTFLKQLTGEQRPTSGRIFLAGEDITSLPVHKRILKGLGRSFQITSVLRDLTVIENVILAVQARLGHSFRFIQQAEKAEELRVPALRALADVGLSAKSGVACHALSYGELRQLEIAMVIAAAPSVLLLDEPMAGMGTTESLMLVDLLHRLKHRFSTILVEHDMDAVFSLADRVSVLVYGRIIACGTCDDIRRNSDVKACYLGEAA